MAGYTDSAAGMTIGGLAEAAGVHVETIRYYQRMGLLPVGDRPRGSIRRYCADAVSRLRFIKRGQALGFSLGEIRSLLDLSAGEHCAETRVLAEQKLAVVSEKLSELVRMRKALDRLIRECRSGNRGRGCPIIESLSR